MAGKKTSKSELSTPKREPLPEPDWLRQDRNRKANVDAIASELEQMRRKAEQDFQRELEAVEIVGNMSPTAKERTDGIGLLMQVFAPGRFLPDHWQRFGLPDLVREWRQLGFGDRIASLETILSKDDFKRFWDKVSETLDLWTDWRKRAQQARIEDVPWPEWTKAHADLKSEWEDVTWWINELQRQLQKLDSVIDKRIERAKGRPPHITKQRTQKRKYPATFKKEANERAAAKLLAEDPNITSRNLGKKMDCDASTIVRLEAWKKRGVLDYPKVPRRQTEPG
jgi:hypothetical protein